MWVIFIKRTVRRRDRSDSIAKGGGGLNLEGAREGRPPEFLGGLGGDVEFGLGVGAVVDRVVVVRRAAGEGRSVRSVRRARREQVRVPHEVDLKAFTHTHAGAGERGRERGSERESAGKDNRIEPQTISHEYKGDRLMVDGLLMLRNERAL